MGNLQKRTFTSLGLLSLVLLIFNFNLILVYVLIVLGVVSILEFLQITKKIIKNNLRLTTVNFFFIFYAITYCFLFFLFTNISGLKIILFILLIGCVASDIGGFIFGKLFKGPKITKISPNKTYAGSIGSILSTTLIVSFLFMFYLQNFNYKIILIAITTSIFCQLGDLFFSYLKRKAKLKDTGKFFPGHGGVLDRLDGIFLGIPFGFLTLILLN